MMMMRLQSETKPSGEKAVDVMTIIKVLLFSLPDAHENDFKVNMRVGIIMR
jgi:hypothetical protein